MQVLGKGYITYCIDEIPQLTVGTISKERDMGDMKIYYCIDVDENRYKELAKFGLNPEEDDLITAVFLTEHWCKCYTKVPCFIRMRTPDGRRCDIKEYIWERYHMTEYNRFEILLANKGKSADNWRVLREPVNSIILPERYYKTDIPIE